MRAAAEKERIEQGLISVREVLAYLEADRYMDLKAALKMLEEKEWVHSTTH